MNENHLLCVRNNQRDQFIGYMKTIKKPLAKITRKQQSVSDSKTRPNIVNITLVSEKERSIYSVPSYGYILP